MTEEKFTPGPWECKLWGEIRTSKDGKLVADALQDGPDARLIAEAPAMFDLIKRGLDIDGNEERQCPCKLCEAGRAIIARVLGKG